MTGDEQDNADAAEVSKSRRKKHSHELQDLGSELVGLAPAQLDRLELPDEVRDAVDFARSIRHRTALKRQQKFIGGLLRRIDVEPIREGLAVLQNQSHLAVKQHHRIESWRDRLLSEGDQALGELLDEMPELDRQLIRQLVRNARAEAARDRPPRSARQLYRVLRESMD